MKFLMRIFLIAVCVCFSCSAGFSQSGNSAESLPKDYLSAGFHAERRQALRALMPGNSVVVIFSYPEEVFSKDVNYKYHPNPDLIYFSGYKEPNAMLLIFKEMQADGDSSFSELFFVQRKDARQEQWTGRHLGVEGVKSSLGFKRVYKGEDFGKFPIDLRKFNVIYDDLPDTAGNHTPGSLSDLVSHFVSNSAIKPKNKNLSEDLNLIYRFGNAKNLARILAYLKPRFNAPAYKEDTLLQELLAKPDSITLVAFKKKYIADPSGIIAFNNYTNTLRGIKTPDELIVLKKSIAISCLAHAEAMRAVNPQISESELEGIMLYVHKKYGAEDEGYPPIVGAGANGCILHYEENDVTHVGNQLVLMDVGAEYHGYSADVTRTFPANGKYTDEQKAIYQIVYDAQEAVFEICRPGISFDSIQFKSEEVVADGLIKLGLIKMRNEVKTYYPHSVSHHLGLDVHDKGNHDLLMENMVITVEPGIYIPAGSPCEKKWWNIGVRIEDDVLIGKSSYTLLSVDAPRKWQDVEKTIAEKSIFDEGNFPILR